MSFPHKRDVRPRVDCAACGHNGRQDVVWKLICWDCATKIRQIDKKAEHRAGILSEMMELGVGMRIGKDKASPC